MWNLTKIDSDESEQGAHSKMNTNNKNATYTDQTTNSVQKIVSISSPDFVPLETLACHLP